MLNFNKNHMSFDLRNSIILEELGPNLLLLDVGSNNGETSRYLAENGHETVGLEIAKKEYNSSISNAHKNSSFHNLAVSREFLNSKGKWDAVLLLSVLHRIYALKGPEEMEDTLLACSEKTSQIFVEGSTRAARYTDQGQPRPEFEDLDVDSSIEWHKQMFSRVLGDDWSVHSLHRLKCSKKEPIRVLFNLKKNPQ